MKTGRLYLLPSNLCAPFEPVAILPASALAIISRLTDYVVEDPKTSRAFLKACGTTVPLQSLSLSVLNEHTDARSVDALLSPALAGRDLGLLSDAGAPGVADPGALLVAAAHRAGIEVFPLVGPSSLLLALMGSGLNGQQFCFHGYLPQDKSARRTAIESLEKQSAQRQQTQIFIETPYRNMALLKDVLTYCRPGTHLCIAADLTAPSQFLMTRTVGGWNEVAPPDLNRRPAVFLILA